MGLATKYSIYSQDIAFIGRADNSVKYTGQLGPVKASAFYSFGADSNVANGSEVPGEPKLGREFGGYLVYSQPEDYAEPAHGEFGLRSDVHDTRHYGCLPSTYARRGLRQCA